MPLFSPFPGEALGFPVPANPLPPRTPLYSRRPPFTSRSTFGDGDDRQFAGTEEGLVDLTTAELRDNVVNIPPRLMSAVNCLQTGNAPQQLAAASQIDISTAWSYVTSACEYLPATDFIKRLFRP